MTTIWDLELRRLPVPRAVVKARTRMHEVDGEVHLFRLRPSDNHSLCVWYKRGYNHRKIMPTTDLEKVTCQECLDQFERLDLIP